ncbi:hypothetical protein HPB48_012839 [Haemaphysalis longicornis]|uniref:Transposable element P transposase-like RNase H domain-containing protein n=1 Tax=Haemaphysalis longicornis TaxID=44386 RepID=A0A9J6FEE2_HAELO|nr:hypothetical protein HPB48_012839 [Haemaphysalis longicornis]
MKVHRNVKFNEQTHKADRFVDYLDDQDSTTAADHALILMFVPLFHPWVQPIASFTTKNAAPGRVLASMVLEAVIQLHKQNATVVAFSVTGTFHVPVHKSEHPCIPDKRLYFLCYAPHISKCIRNHLLRHKFGMISENKVNFENYRELQKVESKQPLRVPKLTKEHVAPDNVKKINVITEFLCLVNVTEQNHITKETFMFASQVTTESLRVTLASVLDLIKGLLSE